MNQLQVIGGEAELRLNGDSVVLYWGWGSEWLRSAETIRIIESYDF